MKWILINPEKEFSAHGDYVITRKLKSCDGKTFLDVTLSKGGLPYNAIAYSEIKPVTTDRSGWYSEYWGDDLPVKSGWYFVSLKHKDRERATISTLWYDGNKFKWLAIPEFNEIIAFMPYPKPYIKKGA